MPKHSFVLLACLLSGCTTVAVNYQTHRIGVANTSEGAALSKATEFCEQYNQKPVLVQRITAGWSEGYVYECHH